MRRKQKNKELFGGKEDDEDKQHHDVAKRPLLNAKGTARRMEAGEERDVNDGNRAQRPVTIAGTEPSDQRSLLTAQLPGYSFTHGAC
eukprot:scaffold258339_cov40-Tisochrysis_lutea.AAC.1